MLSPEYNERCNMLGESNSIPYLLLVYFEYSIAKVLFPTISKNIDEIAIAKPEHAIEFLELSSYLVNSK